MAVKLSYLSAALRAGTPKESTLIVSDAVPIPPLGTVPRPHRTQLITNHYIGARTRPDGAS